jgi:hypothetical protein
MKQPYDEVREIFEVFVQGAIAATEKLLQDPAEAARINDDIMTDVEEFKKRRGQTAGHRHLSPPGRLTSEERPQPLRWSKEPGFDSKTQTATPLPWTATAIGTPAQPGRSRMRRREFIALGMRRRAVGGL